LDGEILVLAMAILTTGVTHTILLITDIGDILTGDIHTGVEKAGITIIGIGVITIVFMDGGRSLPLVVQTQGLQPLQQIRPSPDVPISILFLLTNNVIDMFVPQHKGIQE
jgi:hypothetical protein